MFMFVQVFFFYYNHWIIECMSFQVVERMLSIPANYWSKFAYPDNMGMVNHTDTPDHKGKQLKGDHQEYKFLQNE